MNKWKNTKATGINELISKIPYENDIYMDSIDRERIELQKHKEKMKGHKEWKYTSPCSREFEKKKFSNNYQHCSI